MAALNLRFLLIFALCLFFWSERIYLGRVFNAEMQNYVYIQWKHTMWVFKKFKILNVLASQMMFYYFLDKKVSSSGVLFHAIVLTTSAWCCHLVQKTTFNHLMLFYWRKEHILPWHNFHLAWMGKVYCRTQVSWIYKIILWVF